MEGQVDVRVRTYYDRRSYVWLCNRYGEVAETRKLSGKKVVSGLGIARVKLCHIPDWVRGNMLLP